MEKIQDILVRRDGISHEEADSRVTQAKEDMNRKLGEGEMPFDICEEHFGLEPDYIDQLTD